MATFEAGLSDALQWNARVKVKLTEHINKHACRQEEGNQAGMLPKVKGPTEGLPNLTVVMPLQSKPFVFPMDPPMHTKRVLSRQSMSFCEHVLVRYFPGACVA